MDYCNYTIDKWLKNEVELLSIIEEKKFRDKIPLVDHTDLHNEKDGILIRIHGMIQDMHGTEFFLQHYDVNEISTDEFDLQDEVMINLSGPGTITKERQSYGVLPIPCLNDWARNMNRPTNSAIVEKPTCSHGTKRSHGDQLHFNECTDKRRQSDQSSSNESSVISHDYLSNLPISDDNIQICHVKTYRKFEFLRMHEIYEFVGFLSLDCYHSTPSDIDDIDDQMGYTSLPSIPHLHCVDFRPLIHYNPLIDKGLTITNSRMLIIRKELLNVFTQLFLGDDLAAEYLLYHLISEIYLRKDLMVYGKFCLNISNIPKINLDYPKKFYEFIELITTKSYYFPMTLTNMNEVNLIAEKNYETNRLNPGLLQLSANTHLLLDELQLTEGKLKNNGVQNVRVLTTLIREQKEIINFGYYQMDFDMEIPILIFSRGKSLLPSDFHVPLEPDVEQINIISEIFEAAHHFLRDNLLDEIRLYITMARAIECDIPEYVQQIVQNDFVRKRQEGHIRADHLHDLLVLTRFITISQGRIVVDEESWNKAVKLEERRMERLNK